MVCAASIKKSSAVDIVCYFESSHSNQVLKTKLEESGTDLYLMDLNFSSELLSGLTGEPIFARKRKKVARYTGW